MLAQHVGEVLLACNIVSAIALAVILYQLRKVMR